jgi:hypothetical protein
MTTGGLGSLQKIEPKCTKAGDAAGHSLLPFANVHLKTLLQKSAMAIAQLGSDISVEFPDFDILDIADSWWNGHYPSIDYSTGESIDRVNRAAEANLSEISEEVARINELITGQPETIRSLRF